MRFHLPALPGRPLDKETGSSCAYSQKVRKWDRMMSERGHEVFVYEAEATEPLPFEADWTEHNLRAASEIAANREPGDFLCIIGGYAQKGIADALPDMKAVEYGIGYGGVFAPYRVFESYAWMHSVYSQGLASAHQADGGFYDAVIPNYFEVEDFPLGEQGGEYLLYVGRLIDRKGVEVAAKTAQAAGLPLLIAGEGPNPPRYGECVGSVGPKDRGELMAGARALLCPTLYVEPFGGVAVEGMLCGTPVICTDWGAFTETVRHGETGWRCHRLGEFVWAAEHAHELDPQAIRDYAVANYSLEAIAPRYERYVEHLLTLDGPGWFDTTPTVPSLAA